MVGGAYEGANKKMIATSYRPLGHSGRSEGGRGGQRENVGEVQRAGRKGAEEEELHPPAMTECHAMPRSRG